MKISLVDYLKLQAQLLGPTKPSSTNMRDIEGVKSIVDKMLAANGVKLDIGGNEFVSQEVKVLNVAAISAEEPRLESDGFYVPTDLGLEQDSEAHSEGYRY